MCICLQTCFFLLFLSFFFLSRQFQDPSHTLAQYGTWALPHQGANEQGLRILVGAVAMAAGTVF